MYQSPQNAIQRARISRGLTQEALAERSGYSSDSIRAWECGARVASLEALDILAACLDAAWLPGVYLREQSAALHALLPDFEVGRPLPEAAAEYISAILDLVDMRFDRQLLRLVADGKIDDSECEIFDGILEAAGKASKAYYEMKFARRCERDR